MEVLLFSGARVRIISHNAPVVSLLHPALSNSVRKRWEQMEVLFNSADKNKMKTIMPCPLASDESRQGSLLFLVHCSPWLGFHSARASLNLMIQSSEIFIMTVRFP